MDILFAVAPNGSTATIAGTSEGVDPVMARFWLEEKKGSIVPKTAPNLSWENFWYYNSAYNIDQQLCVKDKWNKTKTYRSRTII